MNRIAFDCETHLIRPGMLFPRLVCVATAGWIPTEPEVVQTLELRAPGLARMAAAIRNPDVTIIGHNVAYDMGILAAEDPTLIPGIFAAYDAGRIRDTMLRQQLLDIAAGVFKYSIDTSGNATKLKYDLASLVLRRCGRYLPKDTDSHRASPFADYVSPPGRYCNCTTWRLHYAYLAEIPIDQWPEEAREYARRDAVEALAVFESQDAEIILEGAADGWIPDERRQTRNAWAFHLQAGWGVRTDPTMVATLKTELETEWATAEKKLKEFGIVRDDGTKDSKLIQNLVEADFKARGEPVPRTNPTAKFPIGQVQTGAEILKQTTHPGLQTLADVAGDLKLLSTYVPILERGLYVPCTSRPNTLVDSGRSSWSDPNWQNPPRKGGVRECVVARPGRVFCFVDFDTAELRALAQTCLELFGYSEMAECLKRGEELHLALGADLLGITYADMVARYDAGDPDAEDARQSAKMANFGFPGGMGVGKFLWAQREFVKKLAAKDFAFDPIEWGTRLRNAWMSKFYEMKEYFALAGRATDSVIGECKMVHPWSGRVRGGLDYCSYANSWFQGRIADGAKLANYRWARACHTATSGPLRGCRPVLFLHDEVGTELVEETAHEAAIIKTDIMIKAMSEVIDRVPVTAKPVLVRRWFKGAKGVYLNNRLVPCKPVKDEKGKTVWVADYPELSIAA